MTALVIASGVGFTALLGTVIYMLRLLSKAADRVQAAQARANAAVDQTTRAEAEIARLEAALVETRRSADEWRRTSLTLEAERDRESAAAKGYKAAHDELLKLVATLDPKHVLTGVKQELQRIADLGRPKP